MKKLFLVGLTLLAACLFTVSGGAVTGSASDEFGAVTYVAGVNETTQIQDKDSLVVLKNSDGTYTTYPAYYISDLQLQWQGTVQYKFDALNTALGTSYSMDSIVRLEILADSTVMNQNGGSFQNLKNLKEIAFPENTKMKELNGQQFKSSGLEKIKIPATVTKIGTHLFEDCRSLKEVTFEEGFSITALPNQMFTLCTSIEKITLPDCVESVGDGFFSQCTSLSEVRLGKSFKALGNQCFALCKNDLVIYAPSTFLEDMASIPMSAFTYDSGNLHQVTLFFEGTRAQAQALVDKASHRGLMEASLVEWTGNEDSYYIPASPTAWTIVYSYNMCEHVWSDQTKVTVTDYFEPITIDGFCTKCSTPKTLQTMAPVLTYYGYSFTEVAINGKYAVVQTYGINNDALQEYLKLTQGFELGIVVSTVNNPLNGTVDSGKTVWSKISEKYSAFDVKLNGIRENGLDTPFVFCAYVRDNGNIYYLDLGKSITNVQGTSLNYLKNN